MNNKEYQLHMVKIVVKACKTLEHMQGYVKENRISQISFIEYSSLLKTLYNEHFIDDDDILSYSNICFNSANYYGTDNSDNSTHYYSCNN